ncbi:MAG: CoA transferase [Thermodesulfobacteriota bacterium]
MMKTALEGLKVLDLSWSLNGLLMTKYLADHGAKVVWIESRVHLDVTRTNAPFRDGKIHPDHSALATTALTSRLSFGLNMTKPRARETIERLIKWADIMVESLRPGVLKKWGIDYEQVSQWKPELIMLSVSIYGQTGPRRGVSGWGYHTQGFQGLPYFTGWPDLPGVSVPLAFSDVSTPWLALSALMAALDYRRKTGKGQYIDFSQIEAALHFIPSYHLLDFCLNGQESEREGNHCDYACPHGVYPCQGDDRWCAITIFSDQEWEALCRAMGDPSWTKEKKFSTLRGRKAHEEELDACIEAWTRKLPPEKVMLLLQTSGVPCGVVQNCADLMDNDPQLKYRQYWWKLIRPGLGECAHPAWPVRLSKTPCELRPTPCFGEHTEYVCREFLNMGEQEINSLRKEDVLEFGY